MFTQKRKMFRRFLAGLLCLCLLSSGAVVSFAEEGAEESTPTPDPHTSAYYEPAQTDSLPGWPAAPSIEGKAAVLMDLQTGAILYSKNADTKLYPASITKIMTCLLACEHLTRTDHFVMSQSAAYGIEPGSSSIYADTGEEFTVEQAIMALMLESANEMALMLGELTSGNVKKFVELMNQRARLLGCTGTHFNNPNGLPDEHHYTTAMDMARISYAAWHNPLFMRYVSTSLYEIPPTSKQPETRYLLNHHKMMPGRDYAYDGVVGGKTGYTVAAGNTLVTYANRGGFNLVAVVLNSVGGAYEDTRLLLDYGYDNFHRVNMGLKISDKKFRGIGLPSEMFILKNMGNIQPVYFYYNVQVTLPFGFTREQVTRKQSIENIYGTRMPTVWNEFTYEGNIVGTARQYERVIYNDLLLNP